MSLFNWRSHSKGVLQQQRVLVGDVMIQSAGDLRLGACSPPVTFEALHRGTTLRVDRETALVDTNGSVILFRDPTCSTPAPKETGTGRTKVLVTDGRATFHFRPGQEGSIEMLLFMNGSATSQQHHAFAIDGGYRIPLVDGSFPGSRSGCSTTPESSLALTSLLVSFALRRRRNG